MLAATDVPFVQPDTLQTQFKYLILSATQFGAEVVLIIWDVPNMRCLNLFMPKGYAKHHTHADSQCTFYGYAIFSSIEGRGESCGKRSVLWTY
jgi:hypothetical protein